MAELCEDCFYKYNPGCYNHRLILSRDKDICEGCAKWKKVVIGYDEGFMMLGRIDKSPTKQKKRSKDG